MGSAAGPKLHGIGRSGDSDIVLCIDAHDAGSYPGQPATNYISSVTGWPGSAGVGPATPITLGEFGQLRNLAPIFDKYGLVPYTLTMDIKTNIPGGVYVYMQNGSYTKYSFVALSVSCTTEYQRFTFANLTPAGPTSAWLANTPTDDRAMLAMYTGYGTGINPTVKNIQIELGAYATPFVESRLADPYAQGYSARPVSVDLMIHGNVGTGTTFEDSSPRHLALTNTNGVSHDGASEFGGSALKFVRSSSQWIQTASTDAADFGTGDWTVDYWFNMTSGQTDRMHSLDLGIYTGCGGGSNISFNFNDGNGFWLYWNGCGSPNIIFGADGLYGDGVWHHMAVTRDGGVVNVYVDGVLKGTNSYSSSTSMGATTNIDIGASGGGVLWDGYLDEIRITKGTALWTQSFTPPTRRNRSAPVVDLSGHHQGGNFVTKEMTDVATYRDGQVIEPVASAVWDFDGTDDFINLGKMVDPAATIGTNGTMCLWINPAVVDTNDYIWSKNVASNGTSYIICKFTSNDYIQFKMYGNWAWGPSIYTGTISANTWTYIVCTWYTDGYAIYKDGAVAASAVESGIWGGAGSTEIWLGDNDSNDGGNPFQGKMGAAALYKSSLSATQIKQNFNAQRSRFKV